MFINGEQIEKIRKYSKLSNDELVGILVTLPQAVQSKYNLKAEG